MRITGITTEKIIEAVKKRPALYDKNYRMFSKHKISRVMLWIEVCREVCNDWEKLLPHEKLQFRYEIGRRWQNIRSSFARELSLQRKVKRDLAEGDPIRKRKKYEYFGQMTFLLKPEDLEELELMTETEESIDALDNIETAYDTELGVPEFYEADMEILHEPTRQVFGRNVKIDEQVLEVLKGMKKDSSDDDRQFLLSLIPSIKKLDDKQKFEAKIGMLKVLQKVTFQEKDGS